MTAALTIDSQVMGAITRHAGKPGPLLLILHDVHDALGYVPTEAVPTIARELNLSRAEVHGVVSFYHYFRRTPGGARRLLVCKAEACRSMGALALAKHVESRLGVGLGDTTADGSITVDVVYCLGNCALAPSIMLDGKVRGRMTPVRVDALLASRSNGSRQ